MQEVLKYLRANGYKTFIATGGSVGFVRVYSERVYGIPPEQVAGTAQPYKFGYDKDGKPFLTREPKIILNNMEAGKLENFHLLYGRRPTAAFGNSSPTTSRCWSTRRPARRAAVGGGAAR